MAEEFNISEVLMYLRNLLQRGFGQKSTAPNTPLSRSNTSVAPLTFQSPIKGSWKNSGDYSPGVATDPRHPKGHNGIDMRAPGGTAVYPMAPGVVTNVGADPKGGNIVNIDHGGGVKTYSAHLGTVNVHKGDNVDINTVIGTVGDSGNAKGTWPHVHFQVWQNGKLQNPGNFFSVPKYTKVDKTEKMWLPGAKDQAIAWSMKDHKQPQRVAFSRDVVVLNKIASEFYKLATYRSKNGR